MTTTVQEALPGLTPDHYPGMMDRRNWRRTRVHQHSRYSCAWCGRRFADPVAVYNHIDARHPERVPATLRSDPATDGREGRSTYPPPSVSSDAFGGVLRPAERGGKVIARRGDNRMLRARRLAAFRRDDTSGATSRNGEQR
jgi:hypothetical protein